MAPLGFAALSIATYSGFCGLAYELLWTRGLLAAITDDTTYAFTLMLAAFLAGHAAGAALAVRTGSDPRPRHDWQRLGTAQILAALTALLSLPLLVAVRDPISSVSFVEGMSFWGARIPFHLAISLARFCPLGRLSGSELRAGRAPLCRCRAARGSKHRPALRPQYAGGDPGRNRDHALADSPAGNPASDHSAGRLAGGPSGPWRSSGVEEAWTAGRGELYAAIAWALFVALASWLNQWLSLSDVYAKQEPGKLLTLLEGAGADHHGASAQARPTG